MTRTGVRIHGRTQTRRRRLAATLSVALVAGVWAGPLGRVVAGAEGAGLASRSSYVVREGDTLWSIAQGVAPGEDPRPLVDAIATVNGVDPGGIVPGQTLLVPSAG
ncbi:MAG: LysM peptidoglycan-binding domain-containing protein [Actinomycetota bacterium]